MPETPTDDTSLRITSRYDRTKGKYVVSLDVGDDIKIIDKAKALRWAQEVMSMVAQAEHDAAVSAQLRDLGISPETATQFIGTLRTSRPTPNHTFTDFWLIPGVSAFTGQAFFVVLYRHRSIGQIDSAAARQHASDILEVVHGADLDTAYLKLLGTLDIPKETGISLVQRLSDFRPEENR